MAGRKPRSRVKPKRVAKPVRPRATQHPPADPRIPVVGIGASAGGLVALQEFFRSVPPNPGLVFIVVQHLDPTRGSEMASLLSHATDLSVQEATDGLEIS